MRGVLLFLAILFLTGNRLMGFTIKEGVYGTLKPEMDRALNAVQVVWASFNVGLPVITSIQDGTHMSGSKHYLGLAFDVRLNNIAPGLHEPLRTAVQNAAGNDYDVVHHPHGQPSDHLHIEFDPK